jgi:flagellar hook-associated protein FlgK
MNVNVNMIPQNNDQMRDFLCTADISTENGYSYTELVIFLQNYKRFYRIVDIEKKNAKRDLEDAEKRVNQLLNKIKILETQIETQNHQNKSIKKMLTKRLSFWERFTGKLNLNNKL